jgi:carbamate kinase
MTETRTAVIAVGGNALSPPGEHSTIADQFRHTRESLGPIVDFALDGWFTATGHRSATSS